FLPARRYGFAAALFELLNPLQHLVAEAPDRVNTKIQLLGQFFKGAVVAAGNNQVRKVKRLLDGEFNAVEDRVGGNRFIVPTTGAAPGKLFRAVKVFLVPAFAATISFLPFEVIKRAVAGERVGIDRLK